MMNLSVSWWCDFRLFFKAFLAVLSQKTIFLLIIK
jgi:hypothetical protein